ncbi:diguanylate cyclase [Kordiimonas lipolytica]|uniref:diguanylate cyclase n=1 Tax=Kordiimonas lipolytica TaxID=1662421 RepID=A0ABV8U6A4_9PROT|nr:diguanylate cyclase [Kordiimonas lipolytica]
MAFWKLMLASLCFALLTLSQSVQAAAPVEIDGLRSVIDVTPHLDILEDTDYQFSETDLRDAFFDARFEPLYRGAANYGFSKSAWWVRFSVKNSGDKADKVTFKLDYPLLDYVDVWVFSGKELIQSWETGNRRAFDSRPIGHRDFLFPLTVEAGEQQTIYMRVRTDGPVNIGLSLYGQHSLLPKIELEYLAFGAYFGGFLLLALCISLLYLVDRHLAFLYYLTYILSYSSYMMAFNGLAFQYLWPDAPEFGQISRPILLTLSIIFLLQFSRSLLGIKSLSPFLHRAVTGLQLVLMPILLLVPFVGYGALVMPLAILNLVALGLVLAMGVTAHLRGEAAARYYLMAWSVFLVGLLLYLLKVFGLLPHNFITHYGFQVGSFFEFIFLSAALGVRVKQLRHQSHIDTLTGLANRRHFDEELQAEFNVSSRPEAELSLLVIDVDNFKDFNDQFGHAAGDEILRHLGEVFNTQIRRPGTAYRYGGEEFTVLLPRTSKEAAILLAERLREQVAGDPALKTVSISIGVVNCHDSKFATAADFFDAGDEALYRAKDAGRNCVATYRPQAKDQPAPASAADTAPA